LIVHIRFFHVIFYLYDIPRMVSRPRIRGKRAHRTKLKQSLACRRKKKNQKKKKPETHPSILARRRPRQHTLSRSFCLERQTIGCPDVVGDSLYILPVRFSPFWHTHLFQAGESLAKDGVDSRPCELDFYAPTLFSRSAVLPFFCHRPVEMVLSHEKKKRNTYVYS
jgi:hypothetical protein